MKLYFDIYNLIFINEIHFIEQITNLKWICIKYVREF